MLGAMRISLKRNKPEHVDEFCQLGPEEVYTESLIFHVIFCIPMRVDLHHQGHEPHVVAVLKLKNCNILKGSLAQAFRF